MVPPLLASQLPGPTEGHSCSVKTADAFLVHILSCPLLINHDSHCAANSPALSSQEATAGKI